MSDLPANKSTTCQSRNSKISLTGDSPNEKPSKKLCSSNNDQTHFVAEMSNKSANKDDKLISSSIQEYEKVDHSANNKIKTFCRK